MRLEGKVALVTGSSQGIGRAIAVRLAQDGADVVVHYHHGSAGAQAAMAEIQATGRRAWLVQADLGQGPEAHRLLATAIAAAGRLDVLVNNAGIEHRAAFVDVTEADLDRVLAVNLKAVFLASQAFVQHLQARGSPGRIINLGSIHEELPFPGFASYCASKGAVRMLTRTLAIELARAGITVNSIAPGAIETPINRDLVQDRPRLEALLARIPLGRLGRPGEVAGLASFLASDEAGYITGATFFIDGGLTWSYQE